MAGKLVRVAVPLCALAIAAGCSSPVTGSASTPTGTTGAPSSSAAEATTSASAAPKSSFTNADLCELLTVAEAARFGAEEPSPTYGTGNGHPQCQWRGETSLTLDFSPDSATDQRRTGPTITTTETTVAGLPAVLQRNTEPVEFCQLIVRVNGGASTMSTGAGVLTRGKGKYEPCEVATELADIVIPKVKG